MPAFRTAFHVEYRIVCAGNHAGRRHIFEKANREIAVKAAERWNKATNSDTRDNCLPMVVQTRVLTTWSEIVSVSKRR